MRDNVKPARTAAQRVRDMRTLAMKQDIGTAPVVALYLKYGDYGRIAADLLVNGDDLVVEVEGVRVGTVMRKHWKVYGPKVAALGRVACSPYLTKTYDGKPMIASITVDWADLTP